LLRSGMLLIWKFDPGILNVDMVIGLVGCVDLRCRVVRRRKFIRLNSLILFTLGIFCVAWILVAGEVEVHCFAFWYDVAIVEHVEIVDFIIFALNYLRTLSLLLCWSS
jgi:hypothetical protein